MKTKVGLQVAFSSLILAFCMIVFGAEAHATTLTGNPSAFNGGATAGCTPHLSSDWIDTLDWGYWLLTPTDCAIVKITTPAFSWRQLADRNLTIPWNFILRNASNAVIFTATSPSPRLLLDDYPLAPGTYSWQVNYTNTAGVVQTSSWRIFSIAFDATTFKLPSGKTYAAMAMAKASPRMLPTGSTFASIVASAKAGELKNPYAGFLSVVNNKKLLLPIPSAPAMKTLADFPSRLEYTQWLLSIMHIAIDEHEAIKYIAYEGKFTGDPVYDMAALARIMSLATWPTSGPTSEVTNDQANREIYVSGAYYPYYNSPHHAMDGRATRYKNALTFDGGIGQAEPTSTPTAPGAPKFSADTRGQLVNYFDNNVWAVVTGDATLAYRGYNAASSTWKLTAWTPLLTEADRTVVFNRVEKVAIIYDYATSATPRQWELNYHTMLSSPFIVSGGTIEIDNAPGKACIDHYGLPGNFTQITAFDVAPENGLPDQNHGRYTATTKSTVLTAVTVIREDCRTLPVNVTFSGSNAFVSLNSSSPIIFDKKTVQVPAI